MRLAESPSPCCRNFLFGYDAYQRLVERTPSFSGRRPFPDLYLYYANDLDTFEILLGKGDIHAPHLNEDGFLCRRITKASVDFMIYLETWKAEFSERYVNTPLKKVKLSQKDGQSRAHNSILVHERDATSRIVIMNTSHNHVQNSSGGRISRPRQSKLIILANSIPRHTHLLPQTSPEPFT
jgi:hypothetical protein